MSILSRIEHHEKLMTRMADRNGADLDIALQSGLVNPGELREAVRACVGCTDPAACEARLDAGEAGLPDYCRNAEMITSIATLIEAAD